jgi:hypothetical protein
MTEDEVFEAGEVKNIVERYFTNFGAQTGNYVYQEIILNRRIQRLQFQLNEANSEIETLKVGLHQAQLDLLAAQGKAVIDDD